MSFAFISNVFLAIFITLMCILIVISVLKKLIRNLWIFTLTFVIAFYVRKWWRTFTVYNIFTIYCVFFHYIRWSFNAFKCNNPIAVYEYICNFQTLISILSVWKYNSYMLFTAMFYNYSTGKLFLLLKAKFQEWFFMDYIFKAYLNSLWENQCRTNLEATYTSFFLINKLLYFINKGM